MATKSPWPPIDGGRLLLWNTLRGLARIDGVDRPTLVFPVDNELSPEARQALDAVCRPRPVLVRRPPAIWHAVRAHIERRPWTVVRHDLSAVGREVAAAVRAELFDVLHVEQLQALAPALAGLKRQSPTSTQLASPPPVLLRAQNVESDLWRSLARHRLGLGPFLRLEARRLARLEGRAIGCCQRVLALTEEDAARLERLADDVGCRGEIEVLPAPFDSQLPADPETFAGEPALVLFGSHGWRPNRDGAMWFVNQVWSTIRQRLPAARLHCFGDLFAGEAAGADGIVHHPPVADSASAMAHNGILVVPLHVASGVRIKILEAWARGLPVIATGRAAAGLGASDRQQLLIADDADSFAAAVEWLADDQQRQRLVATAREFLAAEHGLEPVSRRLLGAYGASVEAIKSAVSVSPANSE